MDQNLEKKINCLVVDDEPLAMRLLEKHIAQFPQLKLVASCWNAIEAFDLLKKHTIDLIFLDIQMPGLTGIDFVKSLQNPPHVIFTTAYREYAVESYELDVIDYLLKPITMERFFKSISKYFDRIENIASSPNNATQVASSESSFIFVNTNRKHIKVWFKDILYVESVKDYVRIHRSKQSIMTKDKISEFEHKLPDHFLRIHRSFIINTQKISAYTSHDIEIEGREIPIGISYKKGVMNFLRKDGS